MDFSKEWKSQFPVGSVFPCPRLITGESAHSLGPHCFSPINPAAHFLSLANTPVCYSPPPTAQDVFSTADWFYRRSDDDFIPFPLIFSTTKSAAGKHSSRHFSVGRRERDNGGGFSLLKDSVFLLSPSFKNRIIRVSVISTADCASSSEVCDQFTEGFVLLCSHYEVHWLRVGVRNSTPLSHNLASATFKNQSAVLLVNGELRLYDLNYCVGVKNLPVKFKGELVLKNLGSLISREYDNDWFCCEFGWHPRVLIVTSKTMVLMVDFRDKKVKVTVLAKIELCDSVKHHFIESDRFQAFCKPSFDGFLFSVATKYYLLLFDTRKPLDLVLQWDHHLDHVRYVTLVCSFRNCEFSLFCYGPHPIVDLKPGWTSDSGSLYAWGLPSEIALVSQDCCCVDCELKEEFRTDSYKLQKPEKVLGFCVLSEPCSERYEDDCTSGFFMIRLTCNGIFETLKYQALWDFFGVKFSCKPVQVQSKTTFPSHVEPEDIDHLKLLHKKFHYFLGYFSGGPTLAEVLNSRLEETSSRGSMHCNNVESTEAAKELILEAWKASGQVEFGSRPSMDYVLGDINTSSSAHEIISKRMWTSLNLCYVELAFVRNSDLNHTGLDFLAIPSFSSTQLPPFPFRVPSKSYGRSRSKATKKCDQVGPPTEKGDVIDLVPPHLVGPVLPLPLFLTFQIIDKGRVSFVPEINWLSADAEMGSQCQELISLAKSSKLSKSRRRTEVPYAVSLSNDYDAWTESQDPEEKWHLFLHETQANNLDPEKLPLENLSFGKSEFGHYKDNRSDIFITALHKKNCDPRGEEKLDASELFDELSPVKLNFGGSKVKEGFKPYQDYLLPKMEKGGE
ncbi:hypothetical protein AMTRI_Chr09g36590 [Amborella trichopoda]